MPNSTKNITKKEEDDTPISKHHNHSHTVVSHDE